MSFRILHRIAAAAALSSFVLPPAAFALQEDVATTDEPVVATAEQTPAKAVPAKIVEVRIRDGVMEDPRPENPFGPQFRNFRGHLALLRQIAADPDVAGVKLEVGGAPDFARSLDLLRELRAIKSAGKKVVCYGETLGQRELVFASLADLLVLPPSGMVLLEGLSVEVMYLKELLAKLDVEAHVLHVGNFKTAYEELSRDTMSAEQRKTFEALLDEFYRQIVEGVAANRGIEPAAVETAFDRIMLEPQEAVAAGLIDAVAYEDEFEERCKALFDGEVEFVDDYGQRGAEDLEEMLNNPFAVFSLLPKLLKPQERKLPSEPRIAIVYATGPIASGKSQRGWDGSVSGMGSETIVDALEKALEDDWVRAVVLRVNSPGGSALASDMIWRATQRVRAKKPIIASMGNVAASGGYWISMGCNEIIAQPSTITGSIGVVSLLPDLSRVFRDKLGINVEVVGRGPHVEDLALLRNGPTPLLKDTITRSMESVYRTFLEKVAAGRRTTPEQVDAVARGRVWTGRQAIDINLVDRLGGLDDAIARACELAGGLDTAKATIVEFPETPNFFEQLEEAFQDMATLRAPAIELLDRFGFGDAAAFAESLIADRRPLGPDRVQALMPAFFIVR